MQIIDEGRSRPLVQALRRRRSLRAGLVQFLYIVVGVVLGLLVPAVDVGPRIPSVETVTLMAGLTAGLLALTGVVFALLFLVVQFAATAQSPRLHLFRDNPLVWHALGLVVGVMVYATVSAVVAGGQDTTTVLVPISVVFFVLVAVALTRRLQFDALQSVQLAPALDQVTTRTRQVIDRIYTAPFPQPPLPQPVSPEHPVQIRWPVTQAVVRQVDMPQLIDLARQSGAIIRLLVMPGDLVRERAVVMEVWNPTTAPVPDPLLKCLEVGIERSFTQDPLFGFRLLNDIALRAMSSSAINDPASVVQAIDCIENLLATLADRDLAVGLILDDGGTPRVLFDSPGWDEFLIAGADEISETLMQPMVRRRLCAMLEHLLAIAPAERRAPIAHRIAGLDGSAAGGVTHQRRPTPASPHSVRPTPVMTTRDTGFADCLPRPDSVGRERGAAMIFIQTTDGAQIYYTDWGAGPPVLLSHGWEHWITHYENRGYTVLAPAYPGFEVEVGALNADTTPIER